MGDRGQLRPRPGGRLYLEELWAEACPTDIRRLIAPMVPAGCEICGTDREMQQMYEEVGCERLLVE